MERGGGGEVELEAAVVGAGRDGDARDAFDEGLGGGAAAESDEAVAEVDVEAARLEGSPAQVGAPDEGVLERVLDQLRVGVGVGVVEGLDDLVDEVDVGRGEPAERGAKAQAMRPLDQRRDPDVDGGVGQELGA